MPLLPFTSTPDNGGDFTTKMEQPTNWSDHLKIKVALVRATVSRAWPLISATLKNNKLFYRTDQGVANTVTIPDGQYTHELLNATLHKYMKAKNHYTTEVVNGATKEVYFIDIDANIATGRVVLIVRNNYILDIAPYIAEEGYYDLRKVLGFTQSLFTGTADPIEFEGDKVPDFNGGVNEVQIRTDLIKGNSAYNNGVAAPILYTFTPNRSPHAYMVIEPAQRIYHDISRNKFESVRLWLTDQDGNPLSPVGERTTIVLDVTV